MFASKMSLCVAAGAAMLAANLFSGAFAAMVDPATVKKGNVGPLTPYGETAAEAAAKKLAFEWNYTSMIERNPQKAFEMYVSKDYCNHGHLSTGGQRDCSTYEETVTRWSRNYGQPVKPGEKVEVPDMASVNGEMVTMYGQGVDIFRVHNGKITDHWDASPPAEITIKGHAPGFSEWVMGGGKGAPPMAAQNTNQNANQGVPVDQMMLTAINTGPVTPYGETAKEAANKRVVFAWNYMSMIQGKSKEAFEKYVSKDFCDHSHMLTHGKKDCATYDEALASPIGQHKPAKLGDRIEMPRMGTVNGEMVTLYGAGVDIFRVQDGKITDHWDASPPVEVTIAAHDVDFIDRMIRTVAGEKGLSMAPGPAAPPPAK